MQLFDACQIKSIPLRWRHNDHAGVSNHQPHGCLLNRLFRRKSKITSKLRVTGLCVGNSPGTGEFPAQMASYAENVSIWWRHHAHKPYRRPSIAPILRVAKSVNDQRMSIEKNQNHCSELPNVYIWSIWIISRFGHYSKRLLLWSRYWHTIKSLSKTCCVWELNMIISFSSLQTIW